MAKVSVSPQEFTYVNYDAGHIADVIADLADKLGFAADTSITIDIDESTPLGRSHLESADPIVVSLEGGAIEDSTAPRQLSDRAIVDVIGRLLLRARDRQDPTFGEPPADNDLTLQQQTAWDAYCIGRLERLGHDARQPRRRYHFRNRHGFTDVADQVFDRLWAADGLTWADLEAACAETAAVQQSA